MRSMTGYGKGTAEENGYKLTIELKSVNHRFLDLSVKLPRVLNFLEDTVRNEIKSRLARGHVDVFISFEQSESSEVGLSLNESTVVKYLEFARLLQEKYGVCNDLGAESLLRFKDVVKECEVNPDEAMLNELCKKALNDALDGLIRMRSVEGEKITKNIESKIDLILQTVKKIEEIAPIQIDNYRKKLLGRVSETLKDFNTPLDESKLLNEVVFYADKVATDEEFTRLFAHIEHFKQITLQDEPSGRQLDFIVQEMHRESNTIGSKCSDISLSNYVVTLKTEIEKVREQIQNIE